MGEYDPYFLPSIHMIPSADYSFQAVLPLPLPQAEEQVRAALAKEQFGIISEIDIQAKLEEKLSIDHPPHKILGACNPVLAHKALKDNADVALALPCNVVLYEREAGSTIVSAMMPSVALAPFEGKGVRQTAEKADGLMKRVFEHISHSFPNSHP